ncbi:MAG: hypothetical protein AB1305_01155 [Candidatus Hadarchaeota archaeon]
MSFHRDQNGFVFSLDAAFAILVVMIVMTGVARVAGPNLVYEQHGLLRLERYANDAIRVLDELGALDNVARDVEYGENASAENTVRTWLRKILPADVQFRFVFGDNLDNLLTVYPTSASGWSSAFAAAEGVTTGVRMATYWDGTSWSSYTIDNGTATIQAGQYTSIALDQSGAPHISYSRYNTLNGDDNLNYTRWTGFDWAIFVIQSTNDIGNYSSLALDNRGYAHVSYFNDSSDDLRRAFWNGNNWTLENVDTSGSVGQYTSIALDNNGYARISYYYATNGDLKYARWTGAAWSTETVDSTNNVGQYTSIALDENWNPHISYYDSTNADLKYARWTGSAWDIQTVDPSANDVGKYSSIELNDNQQPCISYYDDTADDLKYARWTGSAWSIQTVDSDGIVGSYTSLDLDTNNNPHISYYDSGGGNLKYAWFNGSSWRRVTVDATDDVGRYSSLALVARGYPYISYYDATNGDLKYARSVWEYKSFILNIWRGSAP